MEYGMILLRVVAGLVLAAHGSQKLFGSFGGTGPAGTGSSSLDSASGGHLRWRASLVSGLCR